MDDPVDISSLATTTGGKYSITITIIIFLYNKVVRQLRYIIIYYV